MTTVDVLIDMTAFDTPSRDRGIGRYLRGLCDGLCELATDSPLSIAGLVRLHGSDAIDPSLAFRGHRDRTSDSLGYQRHKLARRLLIGTAAHRAGARLLHLPDPPGTPIDMRVPRLVTCHDLIPLVLHEQYARFVGGRQFQWMRAVARYRTAERVLAISQHTKRDLIEHLGIAADRIDVVPHGVDHDRFTASPPDGTSREQERLRVAKVMGTDAPYALYLGAADPRKNVPMLVSAYARSGLADQLPLALVGPMSPRQRTDIMRVASAEGISRSIQLLGFMDESLIAPLYRNCLLHVFPSSYEGFGLPILEAMACGAPTIASQASSLAEVAGDAALTMPAPEVDALATAMRRLAGDDELRADLRTRGLTHVKQFTWKRCARETMQVYQRMLS